MGTWGTESLFEFFDALLAHGASLRNWGSNRNLLRSCSFDDFWGLIWQLQVAQLLSHNGIEAEWMKSGPDLKALSRSGIFYIECYTYRKSFAIKEFIEEVFRHIHPQIRVRHVPCVHFSLPKDSAGMETCLDELFRPYLNPGFVESKAREAEVEYPILLQMPQSINNLYVYMEGSDPTNYIPGKLPMGTGDPERYLRHAIEEALNNKRGSNQLQNHHPNLLAVNYLLDTDFQMSLNRQRDLRKPIPLSDLGPAFDSVLLAACGIDEHLSVGRVYLKVQPGQAHPIPSVLPLGRGVG